MKPDTTAIEYEYLWALIQADWSELANLREVAIARANMGDVASAALAVAIDDDLRAAWSTP